MATRNISYILDRGEGFIINLVYMQGFNIHHI